MPNCICNFWRDTKTGRVLYWLVDGDKIEQASREAVESETTRGKVGAWSALVLMIAINVAPGGGGAAKGTTKAAQWGSKYVDNLMIWAKNAYPKLVGKIHKHHVIPNYLKIPGYEKLTVELPAEYHQLITNRFRELIPYGHGHGFTNAQKWEAIERVYREYPIPGLVPKRP